MRNMPAAEADVVSNAILRDSGERVVQRLYPEIGPLAIFGRALLYQMVIHIGQHRIVHLEEHTAIVNGPIFFAERIRNSVNIVVLVGIIFVHAVVRRAGRSHRGKESLFNFHLLERTLEIGERAVERAVILIANRADACFRDGAPRQTGKLLENSFGEPLAVAAQPKYRAALVRTDFESADSLQNVVGPTDLAIFTVADDIDPHVRLFADNLQSLLAQYRVVLRHVLGFFSGRSQFPEFLGPHETSDVGRQYTLFATLHEIDSPPSKRIAFQPAGGREMIPDLRYHFS